MHHQETVLRDAVHAWEATWWQRLLPASCLICGHHAAHAVCSRCEQSYWAMDDAVPRCARCAVRLALQFPLAQERHGCRAPLRECGHCRTRPPTFDAAFALADYRAPLDALIVALKYQGRVGLASDLARRLALRLRTVPIDARPDVLVPAPLSAERLSTRGYNQAWEITRRLGAQLATPTDAGLLLRAHTDAQAGLGRLARRRNLRRAFYVTANVCAYVDAHIGVVDDVMTTGATQDAMAAALKRHGARRVTAIVVFRTA